MTTPTNLVEHARELREHLNNDLPNGVGNTIDALCDEIERLDAECERAWEAYRIAHDQAMSNGEAALQVIPVRED